MLGKGNRPTVGIVGACGSMGKWISKRLLRAGYQILARDKDKGTHISLLVRGSGIIILAVPYPTLRGVLREMVPYLREDHLLMDIGSNKAGPIGIMLKDTRCSVVGAHPLFGPESFPSDDLKVALCPGRGLEAMERAERLWSDMGLKTFSISAEDHDFMVGMIQGLYHLVSIAFGLLITGMDVNHKSILKDISTPNFRIVLERLRRMAAQNIWLFESIVFENKYVIQWLRKFIATLETLSKCLEDRDVSLFEKSFEQIRKEFSDERDMGSTKKMG